MAETSKSKDDCGDGGDGHSEAEELTQLTLEKLNFNPNPRKKLLVLGIGGLLCHRVYLYGSHNTTKIPSSRNVDATYGSFNVYRRPYCEDFMKFCLERFEVGIWASAKERNLDSALDCVMKGLRKKLVFSWDQGECTDLGFMSLEKSDKPLLFKELKKIWENNKNTLPSWISEYSSSNTLLVTTPYKALLNPPYTAIFPDEYKVDQVDDMSLGPEGELRLYLEGVVDAEDVPTYVKEHPIGQPAITSAHSDWEYYSRIISHFQNRV